MTTTKKKSTSGASNGASGGAEIKNDNGQYLGPDGAVIDPPVIQSFEQRLADAHTRADDDDIADVMGEYEQARDEQVRKLHRRAADRKAAA